MTLQQLLSESFIQSSVGNYTTPDVTNPSSDDLKRMMYDFYFLGAYVLYNDDLPVDDIDSDVLHDAVTQNFAWMSTLLRAVTKFSLGTESYHYIDRAGATTETDPVAKFKAALVSVKKTTPPAEQDAIVVQEGLSGEQGIYNFREGAPGNSYYQYGDRFATLIKAQRQLGLSNEALADILIKGFLSDQWAGKKGPEHGRLWATIAKNWKLLLQQTDPIKASTYAGTIINLQHGSGSVFNKLQTFWDSSEGYDWLDTLLNFKSTTKSVWDYEDRISAALQPLIPRLGNILHVDDKKSLVH